MGEHDRIATTGFSKMSDRQVGLWEASSLTNLKTTTIDQSSGVMMPFWSDNNLLFLGAWLYPQHLVRVANVISKYCPPRLNLRCLVTVRRDV